MNRVKYKVYLKDSSFVVIWFSGNQLEQICKEYDIKYEVIDNE